MPETETPKVVPERNDFKKEPVFVKANISDQAGARPGYVRRWFHKDDPKHRSYFEKFTREQLVGDSEIGYCKAEAWTVVEAKHAKPGRKRDDDGRGVETALTHGDLICLETTEENFRIFEKYEELKSDARERALRAGESETTTADNGGAARYQARLAKGDQSLDARAVLNQQ